MATNLLEQLAAERYEHAGYFVRRNIKVEKRSKGGYETELDVVAFHPTLKRLVHVESSMDADSWDVRETRYRKKFDLGKKHIPLLFKGLDLPTEVDQIALLHFASTKNYQHIGGGRIVLVGDFIAEIMAEIRDKSLSSDAISEQFVILRTLQFVCQSAKQVVPVLTGKTGGPAPA